MYLLVITYKYHLLNKSSCSQEKKYLNFKLDDFISMVVNLILLKLVVLN